MRRLLARTRLRLRDAAVEADRAKALAAHVMLELAARGSDPLSHLRAIVRFLVQTPGHRRAAEMVARATTLAARCAPRLRAGVPSPDAIDRAIIAKRPRGREKGALVVKFESELLTLCLSPSFADIEQMYDIIFIPSWQPFYSVAFFVLLAIARRPFWLLPSGSGDVELARRIAGCRPLALKAASWVHPEIFKPLAQPRDIDLLMVANYETYKRHWLFFEALAGLPKTTRAVVAGVSVGARTKETIEEEAELFGVRERVEILDNVAPHELPRLMARARLFCALSHREGSYIAVAEALMAGTPVGMYEHAHVGTRDFVNDETGVLFTRRRSLAAQIREFLPAAARLRPDRWARRHISCLVSTRHLGDALRSQAEADGQPWSTDLSPLYCQRLSLYYVEPDAEAEMAATYADFKRRFGLEVRRPAAGEDAASGLSGALTSARSRGEP